MWSGHPCMKLPAETAGLAVGFPRRGPYPVRPSLSQATMAKYAELALMRGMQYRTSVDCFFRL